MLHATCGGVKINAGKLFRLPTIKIKSKYSSRLLLSLVSFFSSTKLARKIRLWQASWNEFTFLGDGLRNDFSGCTEEEDESFSRVFHKLSYSVLTTWERTPCSTDSLTVPLISELLWRFSSRWYCSLVRSGPRVCRWEVDQLSANFYITTQQERARFQKS